MGSDFGEVNSSFEADTEGPLGHCGDEHPASQPRNKCTITTTEPGVHKKIPLLRKIVAEDNGQSDLGNAANKPKLDDGDRKSRLAFSPTCSLCSLLPVVNILFSRGLYAGSRV